MKINPKAETILQDGWYPATIGEVEEKDTQFGEKLMVPFEVDAGDGTFVAIDAFISFSDHPKANMVKWGKSLFGHRPFDTDEFSGLNVEVSIEEGEDKQGEPKNFIRKVRLAKGAAANGKAKAEASKGKGDDVDLNEADFDEIPF